MNDALQSIRSTSADGAQRIGDASRVMVEAAEALSQFVRGSVTAATEASGHEIERAGQEMASGIAAATATMRDSLLDPMNSLVERVRGLASGVETATGRLGEYAESVENSTTAIVSANEGLGRSTETHRRDRSHPGRSGGYRVGDPDHGRPRGNSVRSHAPDDRTHGSRHAWYSRGDRGVAVHDVGSGRLP